MGETLTTALTGTIPVPTSGFDSPLLPAVAWLASVKTVVEGGVLGCNGGLPAAVFVEPVSLLFGFVFSVRCGRFGNLPCMIGIQTCWKGSNSCVTWLGDLLISWVVTLGPAGVNVKDGPLLVTVAIRSPALQTPWGL